MTEFSRHALSASAVFLLFFTAAFLAAPYFNVLYILAGVFLTAGAEKLLRRKYSGYGIAAAAVAVGIILLLPMLDVSGLVIPAAAGIACFASLILWVAMRQAGLTGANRMGLWYFAVLAMIFCGLLVGSDLEEFVFILVLALTAELGSALFGRLLGGRKMFPKLGSSRTWPGFWGSLFACFILGACFPVFVLVYVAGEFVSLGDGKYEIVRITPGDFVLGIVTGLLVAVLAAASDAFISWMRSADGGKGGSGFLTGKEGLFDRLASTLFALTGFFLGAVAQALFTSLIGFFK